MERIRESDVRKEKVLYLQPGKVEVSVVTHFNTKATICMKKIFVDNIYEATEIQSEFIAMAYFEHPNILSLKGASLEGNGKEITHVLIYMDYFPEGDLEKHIQGAVNSRSYFSEETVLEYLKQLVSGYSYMEKKNIAHRDIKPQNIFLSGNGKVLKIGDLGSAIKKEGNSGATLTGTPLYLSPLLRKALSLQGLGGMAVRHNIFKSDVYSLGLTLLYMASLKPVSDLVQLDNLESRIKQRLADLPEQYPVLRQVLQSMLEVEEQLRPDFTELNAMVSKVNKVDTLTTQTIISTSVHVFLANCKCSICSLDSPEDQLYVFSNQMICFKCYESFMSQRHKTSKL